MNELTVSIPDEDFTLVQQLAKRYRATPLEIVQVLVDTELASIEIEPETDAMFLNALNPSDADE
jgi:hypothetical protein